MWKNYSMTLMAMLLLSACGGGGGGGGSSGGTNSGTAEGLWSGKITESKRIVQGLILEDGTSYFIYGEPNESTNVAGAIYGKGTSNNGSFTGTMKDFSVSSPSIPASATVSGTYNAKYSLSGSATYTLGYKSNFSFSYQSSYDSASSLSDVGGSFSSSDNTTRFTINGTNGSVSGTSDNCSFTGSLTGQTKNYFSLSVTFSNNGSNTCALLNQTLTGVAFYDRTNRILYAMGVKSDETGGFIVMLSKN